MSYPADFKPNFHSEHSVVLPHPIASVFSKLATPEGLEASIRLSKLCTGCELLQRDQVSASGPLSAAHLRTAPANDTAPDALSRQHFTLKETVPIIPKLYSTDVHLSGTLTWDANVNTALYETTSDKGLWVWKLRTFESLEDGTATRVSETIKGMCPSWQQFIVQNVTTKGHK